MWPPGEQAPRCPRHPHILRSPRVRGCLLPETHLATAAASRCSDSACWGLGRLGKRPLRGRDATPQGHPTTNHTRERRFRGPSVATGAVSRLCPVGLWESTVSSTEHGSQAGPLQPWASGKFTAQLLTLQAVPTIGKARISKEEKIFPTMSIRFMVSDATMQRLYRESVQGSPGLNESQKNSQKMQTLELLNHQAPLCCNLFTQRVSQQLAGTRPREPRWLLHLT